MIENLFSHILTVSVSMSAVIAVVFVLMHFFGKTFAVRTRYLVWTVLILRLCIPFGTIWVTPLFTWEVTPPESAEIQEAAETEPAIPDTWAAEPAVQTEITLPPETYPADTVRNDMPTASRIPENISAPSWETEKPEPVQTAVPEPEIPETKEHWSSYILPGLQFLWLITAICFFAGQLIGYTRQMRSLRRTMLVPEAADKELYLEICRDLSVRHPPKLVRSALAGSPMVCGFLRPLVVLPDMALEKNALRGILTHELIHYRRGDIWRKLAALFARSLHWFNPLVHLACARFMSDMEMACDEAVLRGLDEEHRRAYGQVMLDIVRRCHLRSGQLTTRFNPRKGAVMERFRNIMDTGAKKRGWWIIGMAVLLCLSAGVFVACEVQPRAEETMETETDAVGPATTETAEEIPIVEPEPETVPPEPEIEAITAPDAPAEETVREPELLPAETVDRTKYAAAPADNAIVSTGYLVDYHTQHIFGENYSHWYVMELPQIADKRADDWNRTIADFYFTRYAGLILEMEAGATEPYKFFSVSYEVVRWEEIYTIAIQDTGGSTASDAVGSRYDIYHYDAENGTFLTTDQFLDRYTDGVWTYDSVMAYANTIGFCRDENHDIWTIPAENFQGVIPSVQGDGLFDVCFQGVTYTGVFPSRIMMLEYTPYVSETGEAYFWLVSSVDAGYRFRISYPLKNPSEYQNRQWLLPDITLAQDTSRPVIGFREESGEVFISVTGKTLDGSVQDKRFLCREAESTADVIMAYQNGWIAEETFMQDTYGHLRWFLMEEINAVLQDYAAGKDPAYRLPAPDDTADMEYPNIPVRTEVDMTELYQQILPNRTGTDENTWILPVELGSGYTMELTFSVGMMGDGYTGWFDRIHITTGDDPITSWRPHKGDGLIFSVEIGDTEEWLLSYTSVEGQPRLYRAYYADSGKVLHDPIAIVGSTFRSAKAVWAYSRGGRQMTVLLEVTGEDEVSYLTMEYDSAVLERELVVPEPAALLELYCNGAPVRFPNTILPCSGDTVEEIETLPVMLAGSSSEDTYLWCGEYLAALLRHDTEAMAANTNGQAEMYRNVVLSCTRYTAYQDPEDTSVLHFLFHDSGSRLTDDLRPGTWNHYVLEAGMFGVIFRAADTDPASHTGAAEAVHFLLSLTHLREFPADNVMDSLTRAQITEYILYRLDDENGSTAEEIAAYAGTYLGIQGFTPAESCAVSKWLPDAVKEGEPERYIVPAHGGWYQIFRITGIEEQADGTTAVDVQFYADTNEMVKSHTYRYILREIDGEWAFMEENCVAESRWDVKKIAI
ncbi:MAG: M56 family metallopeptidase [Clostridia bacterium]|nr:M56 family metallopeptidase [Clostridia bacterium]